MNSIWKLLVGTAGGLMLVASSALAQTQTVGQGTVAFYAPFNGPALLTTQKVTFAPGTGNQWHVHPGPVFVVIVAGTMTEETGCGEVTVYRAGDAFTESYPPDRVHRIRNDDAEPAVLVSTVIKPPGTVATNFPEPLCGPPKDALECMDGGWTRFGYPRTFENEGDCVSYTKVGR